MRAAVLRCRRQVGAVSAARVAAGRHGGANAGQRAYPRGDDGDGRRLSRGPLHAVVYRCTERAASRCDRRRFHRALCRFHRSNAK